MFLLVLYQGDHKEVVGLFESLSDGREFMQLWPGYAMTPADHGDVNESVDPQVLPEYTELEYRGHRYPLTQYSFPEDELIEVEWFEFPNLSQEGHGLLEGSTRVDAYSIDNADVKAYIEMRESKFCQVKDYLLGKGYEVDRSFAGSEDGEAIVYRHKDDNEWHFLTHMDAYFVEAEWDDSDMEELLN